MNDSCLRRVAAIALVSFSSLIAVAPARAEDRVHPLYRLAVADEAPLPVGRSRPAAARTPAEEEDDRPVYKNWWFWALTAVVVGGVVVLGVASVDEKNARPPRPCSPDFRACFGDGR